MTNTAGPKGYTRKPYQQPRKSKNSDYDVPQMQRDFAIGMGATAAGVTGMMGALMLSTLKETPAEKKLMAERRKRREQEKRKQAKITKSSKPDIVVK
tara:strand:+ start:632 stop:922 length:291 start_codon:yes stop_codon:yes gene_type:complete